MFLKLFISLKKKGYKFRYYLIGSGSPHRLKVLAKKLSLESDIFFLGSLSHQAVLDKLDSFDLYIHPSKAEGLPRSLIEAMSRGLPCIAANTSGNPELLPKEYIFEKGDINQIYNLIKNITDKSLNTMSSQNLSKSQLYRYELLQKRRFSFFHEINSQILKIKK